MGAACIVIAFWFSTRNAELNTFQSNSKYMPAIYGGGNEFGESRVLFSEFGLDLGTQIAQKYYSSALAPNGYIYCAPYVETQVLKIDPDTNKVSKIGSVYSDSNNLGRGATDTVLAKNGNLYGIPLGGTRILEINPNTDTTTLVGPDLSTLNAALYKYSAGVLADNGYIYCIPANTNKVLKFDPIAKTAITIGSDYGSTLSGYNYKWNKGILASNGKIYCGTINATKILMIDPSTDTTALVGPENFNQMCITPEVNKKIYFIRLNSHYTTNSNNYIYEYDIDTGSGVYLEDNNYCFTGSASIATNLVKFPNGKIYGNPILINNIYHILELNTRTRTSKYIKVNFNDYSVGYSATFGRTLAPNGKIYSPPCLQQDRYCMSQQIFPFAIDAI